MRGKSAYAPQRVDNPISGGKRCPQDDMAMSG